MTQDPNQRGVAPIDRPSAAAQVADRLRQAILEGVFAPGDHLTESELTKLLNVSRGPIREGMQRLIQEGLLMNEPHRGIFVALLDHEDVEDVYLVREGIEREAIRYLTRSGRHRETALLLAEITAEMAEAADDEDWNRVSDADLRFHQCLVDACKSPRLSRVFSTLIAETRMCLRMLSHAYPGRNDLVEEHDELQHLIAAGDHDSAVAALDRHFSEAIDTLGNQIEDRTHLIPTAGETEEGL